MENLIQQLSEATENFFKSIERFDLKKIQRILAFKDKTLNIHDKKEKTGAIEYTLDCLLNAKNKQLNDHEKIASYSEKVKQTKNILKILLKEGCAIDIETIENKNATIRKIIALNDLELLNMILATQNKEELIKSVISFDTNFDNFSKNYQSSIRFLSEQPDKNIIMGILKCKNIDFLKYLKNDLNVDVFKTTTINGKNSLFYCTNKELDLVQFLIQNGVNPNQKDNSGITPLMAALLSNSKDLFLLLRTHGASFKNFKYTPTNTMDISQKSNEHMEQSKKGSNIYQYLAETNLMDKDRINLLETVMDDFKDENINAINELGENSLFLTATNKSFIFANFLIKNGINVNQINKAGNNILFNLFKLRHGYYSPIQTGTDKILDLILKSNIDLTRKNFISGDFFYLGLEHALEHHKIQNKEAYIPYIEKIKAATEKQILNLELKKGKLSVKKKKL